MPKPVPLPLVRVHADWVDAPPPQLAVTINDAARISALGRTSIYEAISDGRLEAVKAGQRTLVLMESLRSFLISLPRLRYVGQPENAV
jgi:hypothetical protein